MCIFMYEFQKKNININNNTSNGIKYDSIKDL